jgi:hypothetical protein
MATKNVEVGSVSGRIRDCHLDPDP